jgi:pimeloyl-ACP methyl ester carboxylesterase
MVQRTEEVCGEKVPLSTLLAAPTIEELASLLVRQRLGEQGSLLVKVQSGGIKPPIFFLHGDFRGGGYYCLNLARGLGEDQPFYALTPFGLDGRPSPSTVEEMAASYISMIRAVEPRGPYVLGGLCNGGIVAFEMARQLQESGKKVVLVALVGARVRNPSVARYFQKVVFNLGHLLGLPSERRTDLFLFWRERVLELCRHYRYAVRRLRKVSESPFGAKLLWLVRQAKKTARNVGRGLRPGVWRKGPGQTRSIDGPPKFDVDKFYRRVLANYIPGRYSGRAVLLWPEEVPVNSEPDQRILKWEQAVDPTLGWGKLAREVEAHKIPGGWTTSLTTHVADLSERLKACIHEALAKEREQERASHGLVTPMERYNSSERPDASC